MSLASLLDAGTTSALTKGEVERAKVLLSIGLKYDQVREEEALLEACAGANPSDEKPSAAAPTSVTKQLLKAWDRCAPERAGAAMDKLRSQLVAFQCDASVSSDAEPPAEPFPTWPQPKQADVDRMLENSMFKRGSAQAEEEAEAGQGLLLDYAKAKTSCDLVAALVQLLLCAPFSSHGFGADMLPPLLDALRVAVAKGGPVDAAAPLQWKDVAELSLRELRRALRHALGDDFFYEVDEVAARCWRRARAQSLRTVLQAVCASVDARGDGSGPSPLDHLRTMDTGSALRSLLALDGVTMPVAASLMLFELQRPVFPICANALLEARNCGWVPTGASAAAAFLHLNARLPRDHAKMRAVYSCMCQQHAFRLTRANVVGNGEKQPMDLMLRERRAATVFRLRVGLRERHHAHGDSPYEVVDAASESDEEAHQAYAKALSESVPADGATLVAAEDTVGAPAPSLPLGLVIRECLHHHELYPQMGCTPVLVVLQPQDAATTRATTFLLQQGKLPEQQAPGKGTGVRYVVEVPWAADELKLLAMLLAPAELAPDLREALHRQRTSQSAAGPSLLGFGALHESALHLAAKCDNVEAARLLHEHITNVQDGGSTSTIVDARGRSVLSTACEHRSTAVTAWLLELGIFDLCALDASGMNALSVAAAHGALQCARTLLGAHASASQVDALAVTPLEAAAGAGHLDVMMLLVESGARVDYVNAKTGRTALHAAVRSGHLKVAEALIEHGASLHLKDRMERLPHEHLPENLHSEGQWLIERGKAAAKALKRTPVLS